MKNALSSFNMVVFATAVGVLVANLYYAQPLLAKIAIDLGVDAGQSGLLVTLSQLGYAAGVFLIVPLGDRTDRRNLISYMLTLCTVSLLGAAASPTLITLSIASFISGITSSATMVIIPYVASHSEENKRGKSVGQIMTGLLLGILLARTVSGILSELLSWRWVYLLSAIVVAVLAFLLRLRMIKDGSREVCLSYKKLMISIGKLVREEPEVRWRSWFTFLGLGSFSVLWTGLTFFLSKPPYNYNTATIGVFGLIGVAGALSANIAGRLGDAGHAQKMTGVFSLLLIFPWIIFIFSKNDLIFICVGIFVVDVAVQGLQVTHQSVLYRLGSNVRSRITSIFITSGFIGMSVGSALASASYIYIGWNGICMIGGSMALLLFVSWLIKRQLESKVI